MANDEIDDKAANHDSATNKLNDAEEQLKTVSSGDGSGFLYGKLPSSKY